MPLCVYESQQWENIGFSTHKRKSELFLDTRPSSSCLPQSCAPLSPPAAPAHWPSTFFFFLTILIFYHFSESFHSVPSVLCYCSFCLGKLIPTFLTSFSLLCSNPGHSSLDYMMHFNLFFSFTGPSSGRFSLMTPVWLRLCSSMIPISTLILAPAFDLFEYKDHMLDRHLLYSDLRDVNTQ